MFNLENASMSSVLGVSVFGFSEVSQLIKRTHVFSGEYLGKRPLARPRKIWVDNIKMNLKDVKMGYG